MRKVHVSPHVTHVIGSDRIKHNGEDLIRVPRSLACSRACEAQLLTLSANSHLLASFPKREASVDASIRIPNAREKSPAQATDFSLFGAILVR
jgi:hypothetical protein